MIKGGLYRPGTREARQYAALPVRLSEEGCLEVLLLTSRETRRWVIPKGWPIGRLSPGATAAREAFEEAGLEGVVDEGPPIGRYSYEKRFRNGTSAHVEVEVFLFRVSRQRKKWPEKRQRKTCWYDAAIAARLVDEPELADLMLTASRSNADLSG